MEENINKKVDETWKEKAKTEPQDNLDKETGAAPEADFKFFITTLGMQAWIALGIMANPANGNLEQNLNQAKFIIDTLGILKDKTKGNLSKEEEELLEHMLYDLRLNYSDKAAKIK